MSLSQGQAADPRAEIATEERHDQQAGGTKTPSSAASTHTEETSSVRTSFLRLDRVHWGFWQSGKASTPEPQSTQVEVFGEVSAPHPRNCEHQNGRDEADQQSQGSEQGESQEATETEQPDLETNQVLASARPLTDKSSLSGTDLPEHQAEEDQIASLERFSPVLPSRDEVPRIQISGPSPSNISLGTKVLTSPTSTPTREMKLPFFGGAAEAAPPISDSANPVPLPKQGLSKVLPPDGLPVAPVPLQFTTPVVPSAISDPGVEKNPPHARKRVRGKLKQKTKPKLVKIRKLVLKKKILSLILGKELTTIVEPHLNAATSNVNGLADGEPPVSAPTPL